MGGHGASLASTRRPRAAHAGGPIGDGDLDAPTASYLDDTIAWYENVGACVFANGFSSETPESANLACWSASAP